MANTTQPTATVVGYFDKHSAAEKAVKDLKAAGFNADQIGLAARSYQSGTSGSSTSSTSRTRQAGEKGESFWERIKEFFSGDSGTGTTDDYEYQSDDVRNSMSGMSVPEERSRYFGHRFEQGTEGAIVTVSAGNREREARQILEQNGADIGDKAANYDYSSSRQDAAENRQNVSGQQRIQLLGEVLRVHKERVQRGEVRLRKEVVTENQTVQVPVTREEFVIERVAASGSPAQGKIGSNQEIRVPLSEERAVLDKDTVVREEVAVGKRAVQRTENVGGAVRHEEVRVDEQATGKQGTQKQVEKQGIDSSNRSTDRERKAG